MFEVGEFAVERLMTGAEFAAPKKMPGESLADQIVDRHLFSIRLARSPRSHRVVFVKFDVDDVGAAAHRTVLDELLVGSCRRVDWDNNLLTAGVAHVARLFRNGTSVRSAILPFHASAFR
jgi:hypothetical protein